MRHRATAEQTDLSTREEESVIGTWRLVSFELQSGGKVIQPYGPEVSGYLIYSADGVMSLAFMGAGRKGRESADLSVSGSGVSYDAFMAYSGHYTVEGGRVVHAIEVSSLPAWNGTTQERHFELDGDRLTLRTTPLLIAGDTPVGCLVWDRVRGNGRG